MEKRRKLVIVGDSAFAEVAYEHFTHDSPYEVAGFSVEKAHRKREDLFDRPVVAFEEVERAFAPADHDVYVAIAYTKLNRLRTRLWRAAREKGYGSASYVSSHAFVWRNAKVGQHCFIFENNVIQPFATIGENVVLWSGNHVGHHSTVRDNCFISSHVVVSGYGVVGENSFLGVNSSIANNVTVGRDNWISPGVVVLKSTEPNTLIPAPKPGRSPVGAREFFKVEGDADGAGA